MNLLEKTIETFRAVTVVKESKNYYFERHQCPSTGEEIKVSMDFVLKDENSKETTRFGSCPYCLAVFYYEDLRR